MRRVFWIALGATAGVLVARKLSKTAHAYTPAGVADRGQGLAASLRYFADEVRAGMAEREIELREALGIDEAPEAADLSPNGANENSIPRRSTG